MMTPSNLTNDVRRDGIPNLSSSDRAGSPALDAETRAHLGRELRAWYGNPAEDKLPNSLVRLLNRVAQIVRAHTEPLDRAFIDEMMASLPSLRAFAISLVRDADRAEDLVQETMLRAISKREQFEPGTNLQAWLFVTLRNQVFSDRRKSMREVEDVDGSYAATLTVIPDQEDSIMFQELEAALRKLKKGQREAILLVGADGLSYEEAAQALGCAVGTIKSRVNRARSCLAELMGLERANGMTRHSNAQT
jgi:RNA polymerase sigma-70 factor, ECF subfamily